MSVTQSRASSSRSQTRPGLTEFEILKASHKFLREDDASDSKLSWDDQLAKKYYDSLYREFALCDLKHYKSGNFALRWRAEAEVLSGAGETTCGNTRCKVHDPRVAAAVAEESGKAPALATLELPFAYTEHGAAKSALVKVVLCARCRRKLMWKWEHDKGQRARDAAVGQQQEGREGEVHEKLGAVVVTGERQQDKGGDDDERRAILETLREERRLGRTRDEDAPDPPLRRRNSRSLSPRMHDSHRYRARHHSRS